MAVTVVQTGSAAYVNTANPTITFGSALTASNVICIVLGSLRAVTANIPSGYTAGPTIATTTAIDGYVAWKVATGGETSAQFTSIGGSEDCGIAYIELTGNDISSPLDGTSEDETNVTTATKSIATDSGSGITPTVADGHAVAMFVCDNAANFQNGSNTVTSSPAYTLQEDFHQASSVYHIAALASLQYSDTAAKKCTLTTTDTGDENWGTMLLFKAAAGGADKKTVVLMRHRGH